MPSSVRALAALATFPAGWAAREAAGGTIGGLVALALVAVCALRLPPRSAWLVVALGIGCFIAVHAVAALTVISVGLATGALAFAASGSRVWRTAATR